jgi:hypothetical protein
MVQLHDTVHETLQERFEKKSRLVLAISVVSSQLSELGFLNQRVGID